MPAASYNLALEARASYKLALTVRSSTAPDAPPMDLTGWEPRLQIRPSAQSLAVLMDCRPSNGRVRVVAPLAGTIEIALSDGDTARLPSGGVYDLIIAKTETDEVRRLLQGEATLSPGVTRL